MSTKQLILDVDAHEMAPSELWETMFGPVAGEVTRITAPVFQNVAASGNANSLFGTGVLSDDTLITSDAVWNLKGVKAPSAIDMNRRLEVMDLQGVRQQLVFPTYGLFPLSLMTPGSMVMNFLRKSGTCKLSDDELGEIGRAGLDEYNDWAVRMSKIDADRLRVVPYLAAAETVDDLMAQAEPLVRSGIRALHLSHGTPPGGRSPAHPELDQFWDLLASNGVACVTHLFGESQFMASSVWVDAPAFKPGKVQSHEIGLEPYSFATLHLAVTNFLTCMTLGGVFERHPNLRLGVIEMGAGWLGPVADNLDMWARDMYAARLKPFASKLPSEYFSDNVRVTPFNVFEPVDKYFAQYPHLSSCYCYSTDFPHQEGGPESSMLRHLDKLSTMGDDLVDKFFYKNAELLFPA
ncbi:MAG: amidohydrolase family protein [Actinomycetota bacterium]